MAEPVEKQISESSSNDDASISSRNAIAADQEKTMLGQTPFPTQLPVEPAPLTRLDSHVPKSEKEAEDEDPFAHLPEHEAAILKRQVEIPAVKVTYFMLYRYATRNDFLIMLFCGFCAIAGGAVMPLMTVRAYPSHWPIEINANHLEDRLWNASRHLSGILPWHHKRSRLPAHDRSSRTVLCVSGDCRVRYNLHSHGRIHLHW